MKYNSKEYKDNYKNFNELFKKINCYIDNSQIPILTKYNDFFNDESKSSVNVF